MGAENEDVDEEDEDEAASVAEAAAPSPPTATIAAREPCGSYEGDEEEGDNEAALATVTGASGFQVVESKRASKAARRIARRAQKSAEPSVETSPGHTRSNKEAVP